MSNLNTPSVLEQLVGISRRAGLKILDWYDGDMGITLKSDDSPLTRADLASHELINAELSSRWPDIPILSEESADIPWETRRTWQQYWLVDPLDGTKEFINRRGDFTVNIALVEKGVPTRGVVYAPAKDRMFFTRADGQAVEEQGPFQKDSIGKCTPISVSKPDNSALLVVASKSHRDQATDDYINKYAVKDMKSAGSSLKFCLVATGEADLYPRLGRTMEWDTAAGQAVAEAAEAQGACLRSDRLASVVAFDW